MILMTWSMPQAEVSRTVGQPGSCFALIADSSILQQEAASAATSPQEPSSLGKADGTATAAAARSGSCQRQAAGDEDGGISADNSSFMAAAPEIELPVTDAEVLKEPEAGENAESPTAVAKPSSSSISGSCEEHPLHTAAATAGSTCTLVQDAVSPPSSDGGCPSTTSSAVLSTAAVIHESDAAMASTTEGAAHRVGDPNQAPASSSLSVKCEDAEAGGQQPMSSVSSVQPEQAEATLVQGDKASLQQAAAHEAQPQYSSGTTQPASASAADSEETEPELSESMAASEAQVEAAGSAQPSVEQPSAPQLPERHAPSEAVAEAAPEAELQLQKPSSSAPPASSFLSEKCEHADEHSQLSSGSSAKADEEDTVVPEFDAPVQQASQHEAQPHSSAAALAAQPAFDSAHGVEETQSELSESMAASEAKGQSGGIAQPSAEQPSPQQSPARNAAREASTEAELRPPESAVGSGADAQLTADAQLIFDEQAGNQTVLAQVPPHGAIAAADPQPAWSSLQPAAAEGLTPAAVNAVEKDEQQLLSAFSAQVQQPVGLHVNEEEEECLLPGSPTESGTADQEKEEQKADPSCPSEEQQRCFVKQVLSAEQRLGVPSSLVSKALGHKSDAEGLQQLQSCDAQNNRLHEGSKTMDSASCSKAQAAKPGFWSKLVSRAVASPVLPILAVGTCVILCGAFSISKKVPKHTN